MTEFERNRPLTKDNLGDLEEKVAKWQTKMEDFIHEQLAKMNTAPLRLHPNLVKNFEQLSVESKELQIEDN